MKAIHRKQVVGQKSEQGRRGARAKAAVKRAQLTVGDLVAAAYDALGGGARDVARVLKSPDLSVAIQRRIVLV